MVNDDNITFHILLYEGNGSAALPPDTRFNVCSQLLDRGYSVTRVTAPSASHDPRSFPKTSATRRLLVLGRFDGGAPPQLEDASGETAIDTIDVTALDEPGILDAVETLRDAAPMNRPPATADPGPDGKPARSWNPWFPVIDYDRCTDCMQCLSFCLFDVYGVDADKHIQVQNNDNCKTNCPACSRVCPEVAIMFPKYSDGPINGEPVNKDDVDREKMKVDISSLLGGDIYATLKTRSETAKSRFSKERSSDKALAERKKCLVKLQTEGLVPPEVLARIDLASLPSPDEIARKAEDAAAKARAARDAAAPE